jgi:1-deoxy-D-xylulose-5-phosphate reductoisomerase
MAEKTVKTRVLSLWGATGSIGTQTLDVAAQHPGAFRFRTITFHRNIQLGMELTRQVRPESVVITGETEPDSRAELNRAFERLGVELLWGREGLLEAASRGGEDLVVNALVGAVGLEATLAALEAGSSVAIANKEVLVMAGDLVTREARRRGLRLLPIDSEHSALLQCLQGEDPSRVRQLILTASGGPFYDWPASRLAKVTVDQALSHPNWSMGKKVTIDSATLMNKGLEVIEARWLFGVPEDRIHVVIHPQSIVHSMVEFVDGSVKAQLGVPDMRIPIAYALTYPDRWPGNAPRLDLAAERDLVFANPDRNRFPALDLAYQALEMGGTATAVLNAADEVAVRMFLEKKIPFPAISGLIGKALNRHEKVENPGLPEILEADRWTREWLLKSSRR